MSGIQDMINRMKQNRGLRPSQRGKFKENNRSTIYSGKDSNEVPNFKEYSKFQIKKAKDDFHKKAKSDRRINTALLIGFLSIIGFFLFYPALTKSNPPRKPVPKKTKSRFKYEPPIVWNGKLNNPLRLPNSEIFYVPIVGNFDYQDLGKHFRISPDWRVPKFTSNLLFLNNECEIIGKLLKKNASIRWMELLPEEQGVKPKKLLYSLTKDETDTFGKINNLKDHHLYISDIDGQNLNLITKRKTISRIWKHETNELYLLFFYSRKKNDSLYGVYEIESNRFRYESRLRDWNK